MYIFVWNVVWLEYLFVFNYLCFRIVDILKGNCSDVKNMMLFINCSRMISVINVYILYDFYRKGV